MTTYNLLSSIKTTLEKEFEANKLKFQTQLDNEVKLIKPNIFLGGLPLLGNIDDYPFIAILAPKDIEIDDDKTTYPVEIITGCFHKNKAQDGLAFMEALNLTEAIVRALDICELEGREFVKVGKIKWGVDSSDRAALYTLGGIQVTYQKPKSYRAPENINL